MVYISDGVGSSCLEGFWGFVMAWLKWGDGLVLCCGIGWGIDVSGFGIWYFWFIY